MGNCEPFENGKATEWVPLDIAFVCGAMACFRSPLRSAQAAAAHFPDELGAQRGKGIHPDSQI